MDTNNKLNANELENVTGGVNNNNGNKNINEDYETKEFYCPYCQDNYLFYIFQGGITKCSNCNKEVFR